MAKPMTRWYDLIQRLRQKYGDEKYEWLVACHIWHVIARRLTKGMPGCDIPEWKREIAYRYKVDWASNCWLCEHFSACSACPLKSCGVGTVYYTARWTIAEKSVAAAAARYIEEVIYAVRDKM